MRVLWIKFSILPGLHPNRRAKDDQDQNDRPSDAEGYYRWWRRRNGYRLRFRFWLGYWLELRAFVGALRLVELNAVVETIHEVGDILVVRMRGDAVGSVPSQMTRDY
jgi:hypothetical protein